MHGSCFIVTWPHCLLSTFSLVCKQVSKKNMRFYECAEVTLIDGILFTSFTLSLSFFYFKLFSVISTSSYSFLPFLDCGPSLIQVTLISGSMLYNASLSSSHCFPCSHTPPSTPAVFPNAVYCFLIPPGPHPSGASPRRAIPRGCRQRWTHISCSEHNSAAHVPGTNGSIKLRTRENLPRGPTQHPASPRPLPYTSRGSFSSL